MPTEILQLLGYDGPNLHGPRPGVFMRVRSDRDRSRKLREALKDGAQQAGMVLGYLEIDVEPSGCDVSHSADGRRLTDITSPMRAAMWAARSSCGARTMISTSSTRGACAAALASRFFCASVARQSSLAWSRLIVMSASPCAVRVDPPTAAR